MSLGFLSSASYWDFLKKRGRIGQNDKRNGGGVIIIGNFWTCFHPGRMGRVIEYLKILSVNKLTHNNGMVF